INLTIEPSKNPYIITPSTFEPGYEANFQLILFAQEKDLKDNLSVKLIDYKNLLEDEKGAPDIEAQPVAITASSATSTEQAQRTYNLNHTFINIITKCLI